MSSWREPILREVLEEFSLKKLPLYYEETIEKYDQTRVKNSSLFLFCALAFLQNGLVLRCEQLAIVRFEFLDGTC